MNQVSPPVSTIALPVPWASAQVSYVQWTVCGEQALPVMSELAGPVARKSAFLLRRTSLTASATDEAGTSTRSEEHTSELQSLMRIPYAVSCLKKTRQLSFTRTPPPTHHYMSTALDSSSIQPHAPSQS